MTARIALSLALTAAFAAAPVRAADTVGPDAKQLKKLRTDGLNYLRTTSTSTGLRVNAHLVRRKYIKGIKFSDSEMKKLGSRDSSPCPAGDPRAPLKSAERSCRTNGPGPKRRLFALTAGQRRCLKDLPIDPQRPTP